MAKHLTARGEPIDMGALISQHADTPALGNAKMNARGDILGKDGVILKTQEQIEAEWAAEKARQKLLAGRPGNIKEPLQTMIDPGQAPQVKKLTDDQDFEPEVQLVEEPKVRPAQTKTTKRRMSDAE